MLPISIHKTRLQPPFLIIESILDEVSDGGLDSNLIKRESVGAAYDCNTYQLSSETSVPAVQGVVQVGSAVTNHIPISYGK